MRDRVFLWYSRKQLLTSYDLLNSLFNISCHPATTQRLRRLKGIHQDLCRGCVRGSCIWFRRSPSVCHFEQTAIEQSGEDVQRNSSSASAYCWPLTEASVEGAKSSTGHIHGHSYNMVTVWSSAKSSKFFNSFFNNYLFLQYSFPVLNKLQERLRKKNIKSIE